MIRGEGVEAYQGKGLREREEGGWRGGRDKSKGGKGIREECNYFDKVEGRGRGEKGEERRKGISSPP